MTLTDEELAEIEGRAKTVFKATWSDVLVIAEKDVPRLISTLRAERDEVKRLRGTLERIIDEASDPAPDLYTMTMVIRLARAALSQPSKEGTG